MSAPATETNSVTVPLPRDPARAAARQLRLYRLAALLLIVLGLLLLAGNLGLLAPAARQALRAAVALLVMGAGLWLARGGRWRPDPAPFAVPRGEHEAARLTVRAGSADVRLRAFAGVSQLAVGEFPGPAGPRVETAGAEARLALEPRLAWPYMPGPWRADLAKGLPWTLDLRSGVGDFDLDLRGLSLERLDLRTTLGHARLTLPDSGQPHLALDLAAGDLHLIVPDGMALKLSLRAGRLSRAVCEARRFVEVAPGEWVTPLFATASQRCTLTVRLGAGDLKLD